MISWNSCVVVTFPRIYAVYSTHLTESNVSFFFHKMAIVTIILWCVCVHETTIMQINWKPQTCTFLLFLSITVVNIFLFLFSSKKKKKPQKIDLHANILSFFYLIEKGKRTNGKVLGRVQLNLERCSLGAGAGIERERETRAKRFRQVRTWAPHTLYTYILFLRALASLFFSFGLPECSQEGGGGEKSKAPLTAFPRWCHHL